MQEFLQVQISTAEAYQYHASVEGQIRKTYVETCFMRGSERTHWRHWET
jgi:hypothetical protein